MFPNVTIDHSNCHRVKIGRLVATPGVIEKVPSQEMRAALARHLSGDWGDLDENDRGANETALRKGTRLLSAYTSGSGIRFWIITEGDRSATTILLPEEY